MELQKRIQELQEGDFKTGWTIFNRFRKKRAVSKSELIDARTKLARSLILLKEANREKAISDFHDAHIQEALQREEELSIAVHMLECAVAESTATLTRDAASRGLTLETDQEIKRTTVIEEHRVEMKFREAMNTLTAISKFKHLQYEAFDEIRGRLNALIIDLHKIQESDYPEQVKFDQIQITQDAIEAYKAVFNAQRNRLVEAGDGETVLGIDALTADVGRLGVGSETESQDEISALVPRGGRREDND